MAKEIIDGSDPYIYIRKGKWQSSVLKIKEFESLKESEIKNETEFNELLQNYFYKKE